MRMKLSYGKVMLVGAALLSGACGDGGTSGPEPTTTPTPFHIPTAARTGEVPSRPTAFEDYATVIADYLTTEEGTDDCVLELRDAWGMRTEAGVQQRGSLCQQADLDGDGRQDLLLVVDGEVPSFEPNRESDLLIFWSRHGGYELAYAASRDSEVTNAMEPPTGPGNPLQSATILHLRDINGDDAPEIAFESTSVGANTFFTKVLVLGRAGSEFRLLDPEGINISNLGSARFEFACGVKEGVDDFCDWALVLRGGTTGGAGSGPQRGRTFFHALTGNELVLARVDYQPSPYLYFRVLDANAALAEGKYWLALGLYGDAITDGTLRDLTYSLSRPPSTAEPPPQKGRQELMAFAHFRSGLCYLRLGQEENALQFLASAVELFPETLHGRATQHFLRGYEVAREEQQACQAMTAFAESNRESFEFAWDYGHANPSFRPEALCLEPGLIP
jgi:hypothetical protein